MKKLIIGFTFFLITIFLTTSVIWARTSATSSADVSDVVTLASDEVIDKDFYIVAGEVVEISGTVNGDVYAAGGQVLIDGVVNGDLMAAGGTVIISGDIAQDVRVAGGQISISGTIGRNVTVAGGNVEFTKGARINGAVLGGAGNLSFFAPIGGDVQVGAGSLIVSDTIDGDLEAYAGQLRLSSTAQVNGNLSYMSDTVASIDEGAVIAGTVIQKQPPDVARKADIRPQSRDFGKIFAGLKFGLSLIGFVSSLLVGLILMSLFPVYMKETAMIVGNRFWSALGLGFATLFLTPIAVVILMITIIGLPLGMLLLLVFPIYLYIAKLFSSYWIGSVISQKMDWKISQKWVFVIGLFVFFVLRLIPFVGGVVGFVFLLVGLGASLISDQAVYKTARNKKLI